MAYSRPKFYIPVFFTLIVIFVAILLAPVRVYTLLQQSGLKLVSNIRVGSVPIVKQLPTAAMSSPKTPVYFVSHGGPNLMYDTEHPAYSKLQTIGKEITQKVKPKAVVVFSAHWEGSRDTIEINSAEDTDLIYDFGGFPRHYYEAKYPNKGSKELATRVASLLGSANIPVISRKRGLDHGVWVVFSVLFNPESNPLNVPIVQVSLFNTEDPNQHFRLGQAVTALRSENVQVILTGMSVHNLRDWSLGFKKLPYTIDFDEALKDAVTAPVAERQARMVELLKRPDARKAHPTLEHLLPIYIAAGAAGDDEAVRISTWPQDGLAWANYRFGNVPESA